MIRAFKKSDLYEIRELIHNTIDASYAQFYPPRAGGFFKLFHSEEKILERSQSETILVIEEGAQLVATGSMVEGVIFAVFVKSHLQRGGRGKALMHALENAARDIGVTDSELDISLPSRNFYESLDYIVVEEKSQDVGEGQRLDFWKARKSLVPT